MLAIPSTLRKMTSKRTARAVNSRGEGEHLRLEILDAAARLLATSTSRDAVTLRAIAREAGIAAPSIYPHFPSRDAVLDAVVERTFVELATFCEAALDSETTGLARLRAVCEAYIAFARRYPGQYRILFERSESNLSTPARVYEQGLGAFHLLERALEQAIAEEGLEKTPASDAQLIWIALHGLATLVPATPGFPWGDRAEIATRLLAALGYTSQNRL